MISIRATDLPGAKEWPQFRGPGSTGVADDPALPDKWSQTENIAWKAAVPGVGWSSPIIWGDRIFVTTVISSAEVEKPKEEHNFGGESKPSLGQNAERSVSLSTSFSSARLTYPL
jgi:hypothetical protein